LGAETVFLMTFHKLHPAPYPGVAARPVFHSYARSVPPLNAEVFFVPRPLYLIGEKNRPRLINRREVQQDGQEIVYRLRSTCRNSDEMNIRTMLIQAVSRIELASIALQSHGDDTLTRVNVKAYLKALGPKEESLEQIVTRLSLEVGVTAVSWEVAASVVAEDASISANDALVGDR
jgi:hypothetical protein